MRRPWRLLLLLLAVLLSTTGCGVKLVYNNAERLTRWWVSDYIDMTREQKEFLNASSASVMYWHRTTQLAEYREVLLQLADDIKQPMDPEALQHYVDQVESWGISVNAKAAPVALQMLLSLSDEQRLEFAEELRKSNREYARAARRDPLAEARRDAKDYIALLRRFIGRVTPEQQTLIHTSHANMHPEAQALYDYRVAWQSQLLGALAKDPPDAQTVADLFVNFDRYYTPEFASMIEINEVVYRDLTLALLNRLSPAQRQHLAAELEEYAEICAELIAEAPASRPPDAARLGAVSRSSLPVTLGGLPVHYSLPGCP